MAPCSRRWGARLVGLLILVGPSLTASPIRAACGDGVLDGGEQCDHGAENLLDGCCNSNCSLLDRDGDRLCDAHDGCDSGYPFRIKESRLTVSRLATPPGDDRLHFQGIITPWAPPAIDPATNGIRLTLSNMPAGHRGLDEGAVVFDAFVPGGHGWTRRGESAWTYRDPLGLVAGVTSLRVKLAPALFPSPELVNVVFRLEARRASAPVTPEMTTTIYDGSSPVGGSSLFAQLALGTPTAADNFQCGSRAYTTGDPWTCAFSRKGDRVECQGPPPVGPCHVGEPDDLIVCDVLSAARAQERYFAEQGTYFTGPCADLPGFVPSPGVTCDTGSSGLGFAVTTAHPTAIYVCTWSSHPAVKGDNLVCS